MGSRFVLQYKLYCELGVGLCRDTTRAGAGCRRATLGLTGRWGAQAAGVRADAQVVGARARADALGAAGERQGRAAGGAAGPVGCALSALSLFLARFFSVLFLSQIFGHCS